VWNCDKELWNPTQRDFEQIEELIQDQTTEGKKKRDQEKDFD